MLSPIIAIRGNPTCDTLGTTGLVLETLHARSRACDVDGLANRHSGGRVSVTVTVAKKPVRFKPLPVPLREFVAVCASDAG